MIGAVTRPRPASLAGAGRGRGPCHHYERTL